MCRSTFTEKALAFPGIEFRFFADGEMKSYFPKGGLRERVCAALGRDLPKDLTHSATGDFGAFSVVIVGGGASVSKRDRRGIHMGTLREYSS